MENTYVMSFISLGLLWVGFFWIYRDYRVDLFREKLFTLRDSLFDLARSGVIRFDDPAYGLLRSTINGTIRFGHRLGLLHLISCSLLSSDENMRAFAETYHQRWKRSVALLNGDAQRELRVMRGQLHFLIVEQILFTSPLLLCTLLPVAVWALVKHVGMALSLKVRRLLGDRLVDSWADRLDCAALAEAGEGSDGYRYPPTVAAL